MKILFIYAVVALSATRAVAQFDPEQCGPNGGNQVCRNNKCCSQYGWCGTTNAYCRVGCNPAFGRCIGVASPAASTLRTSVVSRASTPSANPSPVSNRNERCGPDHGRASCIGSIYGSCCSQYGWCGTTPGHCKTGCQSGFGTCFGLFPSPGSSSRVSSSSSQSLSAARSSQSTSHASSTSSTVRSASSSTQSLPRSSGFTTGSGSSSISLSSTATPHVIASGSTQPSGTSSAPSILPSSSLSTQSSSSHGLSSSSLPGPSPSSGAIMTASSSLPSTPSSISQSTTPTISASPSAGNVAATSSSASPPAISSSGSVLSSSTVNSISASPLSNSPAASPSASDVPRIWIPARNPNIDRTSADRLVPAHVLTLYYVEQTPGTAAKFDTVTLVGDSKGVLLEDIDAVYTVTCSGAAISIAFTDETIANIAKTWPAGTLLFTSVAGCGPADGSERGVYSLTNEATRRSLARRQSGPINIFTIIRQAMASPLKSQIGSLISQLLMNAITPPMTASSIASPNSVAAPVKPSTAVGTTTQKAPVPSSASAAVPQSTPESKASLPASGQFTTINSPTSASPVPSTPAEKSDAKSPLSTPVNIPSTASSVADTLFSTAGQPTPSADTSSSTSVKDLGSSQASSSAADVSTPSLIVPSTSSLVAFVTPTPGSVASTPVKSSDQTPSSASAFDISSNLSSPTPSSTPVSSSTTPSADTSSGSSSPTVVDVQSSSQELSSSLADSTSTTDSATSTLVDVQSSNTPTPSAVIVVPDFCLKVITPGVVSNGYFITSSLNNNGGFFINSEPSGISHFALDDQNTLLVITPGLSNIKVTGYSRGTSAKFRFNDMYSGFNPTKCTIKTDVAGFLGQQVLKCTGGFVTNPVHTYTGFRQYNGNQLWGAEDFTTNTDTDFIIDLGVFAGSDCSAAPATSSSDSAVPTSSSTDLSSPTTDALSTPAISSSAVVSDPPSSLSTNPASASVGPSDIALSSIGGSAPTPPSGGTPRSRSIQTPPGPPTPASSTIPGSNTAELATETTSVLLVADTSPSETPAESSGGTPRSLLPQSGPSTTSDLPVTDITSPSATPPSPSDNSATSLSSSSSSSTPTPSSGPVYSNFCLRVLTSGRNQDFVVKSSTTTKTNGNFYLESAKDSTLLPIARFSIDDQGVLYVNTPGIVGTVITRYSNGSGARFLWQKSASLPPNTCTVRTDVEGYNGNPILKCSGGNSSNYKFTAFTAAVQVVTTGPDILNGAIETSVDGSITPADPSTLIELGLFWGEYCPGASII